MTVEEPDSPQPVPEGQGPAQVSAKQRNGGGRLATILVVIVAVVAVGAYLVVSNLGNGDDSGSGYTHSAPEYSVTFPGEPQFEEVPGFDDQVITMAIWEGTNEAYASAYTPVRLEGMTIEESLQGGFDGAGATLETVAERTVPGGQGLYGEGVLDENGTKYRSMAVFIDGDDGVFSLTHIGDDDDVGFFNSFEVSEEFMESLG